MQKRKQIEVYDNGGKSADRYTVIIGSDVWFVGNDPRSASAYAGEVGEENTERMRYPHSRWIKGMKEIDVGKVPKATQKWIAEIWLERLKES